VRGGAFENLSDGAGGGFAAGSDDDDNGPPSSVNVARALASLRGHELRRLDEILTQDDEVAPAAAPAAPAQASVPTVGVGPSILLVELARRMSIAQEELVTALVTRGFFDVTVKATLPRETARAAAAIFGWTVEDTDEALPAPAKAKMKVKAKASAKPKPTPKVASAKTATKVGPKAATKKAAAKARPKAKPRPATPARRTSRRA
jgi:hypothetical protein